ncbi:hypothetical protein [Paenibacillus polymyxa]|nr:hypothetical protein [Paenibacillus polymyxa]WCM63769.1 hypothetical protein OYT09_12935 [Paenibacillus polymyxa]
MIISASLEVVKVLLHWLAKLAGRSPKIQRGQLDFKGREILDWVMQQS